MPPEEPLKFIVAPHIVQDLGLNLYTNLPRVLVEFVANSYDADSAYANIKIDRKAIEKQRGLIRKQWETEKRRAGTSAKPVKPLEERTLPTNIQIVIEDRGHGMSRDDLQDKFLIAGLRRREQDGGYSPGGRVLMGRKGLGKLAGFGVAQHIVVTSRKQGEAHATEITLDYEELIQKRDTNEIPIHDRKLSGRGMFESGTRIVLSKLLYEPMKSRLETVAHEIADHFTAIEPSDFVIKINDKAVKPTKRNLEFAWPAPEKPIPEMVTHTFKTEDGRDLSFQYRIRFTRKGEALPARDRGVRVYAHKRLAAVSTLLDADTNMHGFRMTDYMDGVVHADFIDDQPADYIATDRQTLRWETSLLAPMCEFLSDEIKEACKQCQSKRDADAPKEVERDRFTKSQIQEADLSKKDQKLAYRVAAVFASSFKKGVKDTEYRTQLPLFVSALGQRDILKAIADLAKQNRPELHRVVAEVSRLTDSEFDDFLKYVKARLNGITALQKICESADFKKGKNEKELHTLFKKCPWLIDPTFTQFLISDSWLRTMFHKLAQELKIGDHASKSDIEDEDTRADLVFLMGNQGLHRLVIVELKAPNVMLKAAHLDQLRLYMRRSKKWLKDQGYAECKVEGYLIGSMAPPDSKAEGVELLREQIDETENTADWKVFSILRILEMTQQAHQELLNIQEGRNDSTPQTESRDRKRAK